MLITIPKAWCDATALILRRGTSGREILIRRTAVQDWRAQTANAYDFTLIDAVSKALKVDGLKGKKHDMDEPGETYAFVFPYQADAGQMPIYTKINLTPDGKVVIIYSAHRPEKKDELTS